MNGSPRMPNSPTTSYDEVIYPGNPVVQAQPDRLATVATLFGMQPAKASRCRVLELGCGIGGSTLAMACQWPQSEFVGIDLSARSIEIGERNRAALGLGNVVLRQFDIMDVTAEFGTFDYIVAHGVYSWVPPPVRERLLAVCKAHLAPQGVGYVSYNAYPGSHLREIARDMMLFHVRGIDDPREKIGQALALLRAAAEVPPDDDLHGQILRDQVRRLARTAPEVVYHDDLEPAATPFMLHQVAEAAARHGLQYLGDANFGYATLFGLPEAVVGLVEQIPPARAVEREQYIDFVQGRSFRRTLLCHDDVVLDRAIGPASLEGFHLAGRFVPEPGIDPLAPGITAFKAGGGGRIETDHPLAKAALAHLGAAWPQSVAFADLIEQAALRLRAVGLDLGGMLTEAVEGAAAILFRACAARQAELHLEPPPLTTVVSERPEASLLARRQVEAGPVLTNLRHARVALEDEIARRFLMLVDGTRTHDALADALNAQLAAAAAESGSPAQAVTREQVEENLRILARLALLVR
jgi:SAM-dependent methyltransferase